MKILICTSFSLNKPSAGVNKMNNLIDGLNLYGIESYICGFSEDNNKFFNNDYFVEDHKVIFKFKKIKMRHSKSLSFNVNSAYFYKKNLETILRELSIDLVVIYSTFSTLIEPIIDITKKNKIKVVAYSGELFDFSIKYLFNGVLYMQYRAYFYSYKLLDGIICASPAWESYSERIKKKSVLLPTFIGELKSSKKNELDNRFKCFRVVVMSNLSKRELPLVLFKTMSKLQSLKENIELFIIGKKPKYSLFNLRASWMRFNLSRIKNIYFTDYLSNDERDNLLSTSACFVLLRSPSIETKFLFPVRIGEYFAKNKPLILSDVNPFNLFFKHKKEVYFISKSNKPNELARAILDLKKNSVLSENISSGALNYAKKYYSINYLGSNVAEFLKDIIQSKY